MTISMIRATPDKWLSTPVCSRLQISTDIGCVPGGAARLVAGSSPSPIANAIAHAASSGSGTIRNFTNEVHQKKSYVLLRLYERMEKRHIADPCHQCK